MGKRADYIWIKVTHDKFELPVAVADTAAELERELGLAHGTVRRVVCDCKKHERWCGYRRIYVGKELDEKIDI